MIERLRSRFVPGMGLPNPLDLVSYVKYRIALESVADSIPVEEAFIDYAVKVAFSAYTEDRG